MGDLERLSKFLAKLLRHDAISRGLDVTPEGYVDIDDILEQREARRYTAADIQSVVDNDRKGRFKIRTRYGAMQIKATQAHSMQLDRPEAEMTPINHYSDARVVLHGTRKANWPYIKAQFSLVPCGGCKKSPLTTFQCSYQLQLPPFKGLSRRNRTHIHFAEGERVRSGFPPHCDMVIEIDLELALKDGFKFYRAENDVILCTGNHAGVIPAKYFKRAYDLRTHEPIV